MSKPPCNIDTTSTAVLIEFLTSMEIAVNNARDLDTLRELIGEATQRALNVAQGTKNTPRIRGRVPLYDTVAEEPR